MARATTRASRCRGSGCSETWRTRISPSRRLRSDWIVGRALFLEKLCEPRIRRRFSATVSPGSGRHVREPPREGDDATPSLEPRLLVLTGCAVVLPPAGRTHPAPGRYLIAVFSCCWLLHIRESREVGETSPSGSERAGWALPADLIGKFGRATTSCACSGMSRSLMSGEWTGLVFVVGRSNRSFPEFLELPQAHGMRLVIDLRCFPHCLCHPSCDRDHRSSALVAHGLANW
jgi:hypothetical protein